jgi:predicted dehydrogenase
MDLCFYGACGHSKTVLAVLPQHPELAVTGYCPAYPGDPSVDRLATDLRALGHAPHRYESLEAMLDAAKPGLLVVDGVFAQHAPAALLALRRGIHVYGEKPLALTTADCDALLEAHKQTGAYLSSMQTARYDAWFYTLKQTVEAGAIGEVRLMNGQKSYKLGTRPDFFQHRKTYGGTIAWVGIHMLDLFLWVSGRKLLQASAFASTAHNNGHGELESTAVCILQLEEGVAATLTMDYLRPSSAGTHGDDRLRWWAPRATSNRCMARCS